MSTDGSSSRPATRDVASDARRYGLPVEVVRAFAETGAGTTIAANDVVHARSRSAPGRLATLRALRRDLVATRQLVRLLPTR
ncbi:hypothetical protein [Patulibacter defluvii]|uniref:hypothetical protein n=1 Tax=Patulibacter defluvii TaxID=3095358 RepID=UPI002A7489B1|nr:hypothetical protein [Patulibacter sp. DM4]